MAGFNLIDRGRFCLIADTIAGIFLLLAWIFDPGEYAAWPTINRLQNGLAVLVACVAVVVALWLLVTR